MAQFHLKLVHLYGNLLNTYSDVGNIIALQYYAKQMNTDIETEVISIDQSFDPNKYDIALFGGGQDYEQFVISKDLPKKKSAFQEYINAGKPMLAICGGYQLLGQYYIGANGEKIPGLSVLPHYTLSQDNNRFIGDITIKNEETGDEYHGFENHNGRTFLGEGERPLGKVVSGHGNNGDDGTEGAIYKEVYCSYFHGPILTRNGEIAKHLLLTALHNKYPDADLTVQENLKIEPTF
ncbi:glutamine amidotransferase [Lactobacillaceae bacterium 24-114]